MVNDVDEKILKELSTATAVSVEQLRAAFALAKLYKRRMKASNKQEGL